jgi:glycosyltransferase involved in cell wall biosynthesis
MGKKICILTTVHPPFDTRIFHKQAKILVKAGYDVILIVQHDRDEVVEGVRIIGLPKPRNRLTRIFGLAWRTFRLALREHADIYHFHDPELLPMGVLLKAFTKGKVIYDVHEDVPAQILTKHWILAILRRPSAWLFGRWEKFAARFFDAVVVATEGIAEMFSKHNLIVIHNYPDLEMLPPTLRSSTTENERELIYVGGISRLRGAVEMVDTLACLSHIDNLRLDLVGRFEPASLEVELQKMQGYQRVHFHGWLQPEEVYKHLARATIGLVCLRPEPR